MRNVKSYLFVSACYTLSTLSGACSLLQRDSAKSQSDRAAEAAAANAVSEPPVPAHQTMMRSGGGSPFGMITSTIVPATMPLAGTGAATTTATASAAAATAAASGSGAEAASAGTGAVAAGAAGDGAVAAAAGTSGGATSASTAFDPATFDEAHGRSKGTAPPGTPVPEGGMECPNEVCLPLPPLPDQATAAGATISLCCSPEGECGTKGMAPMSMMGGGMMNDPDKCRIIPDSDPQCSRLIVMGFEIASCCTAEGQCGINSDGAPMAAKPCTSIEEANMNIGTFITLPAPASCLPGMGPPHSSSAPAPGSSTTTSSTGAAGTSAADSGATTAAAGSGATTAAAGSGASAPAAGSGATQASAGSAAP